MKYFRNTVLMIYLIAILIVLSSGGCGVMSNLEKDHTFVKGNNYSILVIGIEPRYRVHVSTGCDKGEKWKWVGEWGAAANVYPEDGYVVIKLKPRYGMENYGIQSIMPKGMSGVFAGHHYKACNGKLVPVFELPPDQVVYVGNIKYACKNKKLMFKVGQDFAAAKEFIKKNYPNLSKDLTQGKITLKEMMGVPCKQATVPIVIVM